MSDPVDDPWPIGARVRHVNGGPVGVIFDWLSTASPYYRKKFARTERHVWVEWPAYGPHSMSQIGYSMTSAEREIFLAPFSNPGTLTLEATHFGPILQVVRNEKERCESRDAMRANLFREIVFRLEQAQTKEIPLPIP